MDHTWAIKQLDEFIAAIDRLGSWVALRAGEEALARKEALIRRIANAYQAGSGDYTVRAGGTKRQRWGPAREAALLTRELAASAEEFDAFLRPPFPALTADALHPWVYEPASPLWAAGAHQDAVLAAARTVNRRLQQRLDRHDIGETDLAMQSFDMKAPAPGKPRLRFPGDRTTPTWKARQDGAKYLAAGAFLGIRNVAAHEDDADWTERQALEHLAIFSVLARWIEECSVESVT